MNVSVSVRRIALVTALALLVLCGPAGPLQAADAAPFRLTSSADFVGRDGHYSSYDLEGMANHFGPFTGVGVGRWRSYYEITLTLENASGEVLEIFIVQSGGKGDYMITGGSGRFASATGGGSFLITGQTDVGIDFRLDGTISY
jgi:hypothetical protein